MRLTLDLRAGIAHGDAEADLKTAPRENLLALVFAAILIFIMVGGSFWIMFDLHGRMSV